MEDIFAMVSYLFDSSSSSFVFTMARRASLSSSGDRVWDEDEAELCGGSQLHNFK